MDKKRRTSILKKTIPVDADKPKTPKNKVRFSVNHVKQFHTEDNQTIWYQSYDETIEKSDQSSGINNTDLTATRTSTVGQHKSHISHEVDLLIDTKLNNLAKKYRNVEEEDTRQSERLNSENKAVEGKSCQRSSLNESFHMNLTQAIDAEKQAMECLSSKKLTNESFNMNLTGVITKTTTQSGDLSEFRSMGCSPLTSESKTSYLSYSRHPFEELELDFAKNIKENRVARAAFNVYSDKDDNEFSNIEQTTYNYTQTASPNPSLIIDRVKMDFSGKSCLNNKEGKENDNTQSTERTRETFAEVIDMERSNIINSTANENARTIINDATMDLTLNTVNQASNKRRTIMDNVDMDFTEVVNANKLSNTNDNLAHTTTTEHYSVQNVASNKRTTIVDNTDMELTKVNFELQKSKIENSTKRRTIMDNVDMDLTKASCLIQSSNIHANLQVQKSNIANSSRRRTIMDNADMELEESSSTKTSNIYSDATLQKSETDNLYKRRTIIDNAHMEMTQVNNLLQICKNETLNKRKTIMDNGEMDLTLKSRFIEARIISDLDVPTSSTENFNKRKTIMDHADMELTKISSPVQVLDVHANPKIGNSNERRTILDNVDMEFTEVFDPTQTLNVHANIKHQIMGNPNKRRTIMDNADMELTKVICSTQPSNVSTNLEIHKPKTENSNKRRTIIDNADMEMTENLNPLIATSLELQKSKTDKPSKRKTIFDNADMELTEVSYPIQAFNVQVLNDHANSELQKSNIRHSYKRRTIADNVNMELTEVIEPIKATSVNLDSENQKLKMGNSNKRRTIMDNADMELTEVVQPIEGSSVNMVSENQKLKMGNSNKRRTIMDNADMELTDVIEPIEASSVNMDSENQKLKMGNSNKRRTIMDKVDMELTDVIEPIEASSVNMDSENQKLKMGNSNKRRTIMDNADMELTEVIQASNVHANLELQKSKTENPNKRRTIIDNVDMESTKVNCATQTWNVHANVEFEESCVEHSRKRRTIMGIAHIDVTVEHPITSKTGNTSKRRFTIANADMELTKVNERLGVYSENQKFKAANVNIRKTIIDINADSAIQKLKTENSNKRRTIMDNVDMEITEVICSTQTSNDYTNLEIQKSKTDNLSERRTIADNADLELTKVSGTRETSNVHANSELQKSKALNPNKTRTIINNADMELTEVICPTQASYDPTNLELQKSKTETSSNTRTVVNPTDMELTKVNNINKVSDVISDSVNQKLNVTCSTQSSNVHTSLEKQKPKTEYSNKRKTIIDHADMELTEVICSTQPLNDPTNLEIQKPKTENSNKRRTIIDNADMEMTENVNPLITTNLGLQKPKTDNSSKRRTIVDNADMEMTENINPLITTNLGLQQPKTDNSSKRRTIVDNADMEMTENINPLIATNLELQKSKIDNSSKRRTIADNADTELTEVSDSIEASDNQKLKRRNSSKRKTISGNADMELTEVSCSMKISDVQTFKTGYPNKRRTIMDNADMELTKVSSPVQASNARTNLEADKCKIENLNKRRTIMDSADMEMTENINPLTANAEQTCQKSMNEEAHQRIIIDQAEIKSTEVSNLIQPFSPNKSLLSEPSGKMNKTTLDDCSMELDCSKSFVETDKIADVESFSVDVNAVISDNLNIYTNKLRQSKCANYNNISSKWNYSHLRNNKAENEYDIPTPSYNFTLNASGLQMTQLISPLIDRVNFFSAENIDRVKTTTYEPKLGEGCNLFQSMSNAKFSKIPNSITSHNNQKNIQSKPNSSIVSLDCLRDAIGMLEESRLTMTELPSKLRCASIAGNSPKFCELSNKIDNSFNIEALALNCIPVCEVINICDDSAVNISEDSIQIISMHRKSSTETTKNKTMSIRSVADESFDDVNMQVDYNGSNVLTHSKIDAETTNNKKMSIQTIADDSFADANMQIDDNACNLSVNSEMKNKTELIQIYADETFANANMQVNDNTRKVSTDSTINTEITNNNETVSVVLSNSSMRVDAISIDESGINKIESDNVLELSANEEMKDVQCPMTCNKSIQVTGNSSFNKTNLQSNKSRIQENLSESGLEFSRRWLPTSTRENTMLKESDTTFSNSTPEESVNFNDTNRCLALFRKNSLLTSYLDLNYSLVPNNDSMMLKINDLHTNIAEIIRDADLCIDKEFSSLSLSVDKPDRRQIKRLAKKCAKLRNKQKNFHIPDRLEVDKQLYASLDAQMPSLRTRIQMRANVFSEYNVQMLSDNVYQIKPSLDNSLEVYVQLKDDHKGIVADYKIVNKLSEKSPLQLYINKLFFKKLHQDVVHSVIGKSYNIFSLLDYIFMNAANLEKLYKELSGLAYVYDARFTECNIISWEHIEPKKLVHLTINFDVSDIDKIDQDSVTIIRHKGNFKVNELKSMVREIPKSSNFIKTYIESVLSFLKSVKSIVPFPKL